MFFKAKVFAAMFIAAIPLGIIQSTTQPASADPTFSGVVNHVRDGDTIVVAGVPIRLAALDCPELRDRGGPAAKRLMKQLSAGKTASCEMTGARSYDRLVGYCSVGGKDLGQQMLDAKVCTIYWHFNTEGRYH